MAQNILLRIPLSLLVLVLVVLHTGTCLGGLPQRIVSLGPMHTKNIYLLGAADRLVANTEYCRFPEAALRKEKIGTVMQVDIEHILALSPDLVLATGLTQPGQIEGLRRAGLRVVQFAEPRSFAEICKQFRDLGRLLGLEWKVGQILGQVDEDLREMQARLAGLPRPGVLLQIGANPLFAATSSSFTNDYILLAGGANIAAGEPSGRYDPEKVMAKDPEVILIAMMGSQSTVGRTEREKWRKLTTLRAVRQGGVHLVDSDLICSPTPVSFVKALVVLSRLIHPGLTREKLLTARGQ